MSDDTLVPHVHESDTVFPPWVRYRFTVPHEDYRPVKFPPPGPYWCTGQEIHGDSILVAYMPKHEDLREWWPDAGRITYSRKQKITFTERFPKPEWWDDEMDRGGP